MSILVTILAFILVFSILVLAHEFGHFIAAKEVGIKVEEFGIGFPPRLWAKKKGETVYSVNAIPFGGFVRLLGLEGKKGGGRKSFSSRGMGTRAKVMVAGVLMNLFLAWLLLSVGLVVGMEPLLGPDDVFSAVDEGVIKLKTGAVIETVVDGSPADGAGFMEGDVLLKFNGDFVVESDQLRGLMTDPVGKYTIVRGEDVLDYEISGEPAAGATGEGGLGEWAGGSGEGGLGVEFFDAFLFPRVKIFDVNKASSAYKSGLRGGDVIMSIDGRQIYSVSGYKDAVEGESLIVFTVFRNGIYQDVFVEMDVSKSVIISSVVKGKPADESGFMDGDVLLSVNGQYITDAVELIGYVEEHQSETLGFLVQRGSEVVFNQVTPEEGKIGVYLSELYSGASGDISVYNVDQFTSIIGVEDERYPFYEAPFVALGETYRMTKMTAVLFADLLKSFVGEGEVPDGVAGPVGIAQMSGTFAREGLIPLFRFIAILSISLAVLNILPFPALDGGKLLFILIEFVTGRKVPQKWENYIHALGFFLILLLIAAVTYRDVLRLIF